MPIHERQADRDKELAFAEHFLHEKLDDSYEIKQFKKLCPVDLVITNWKLLILIEHKARTHTYGTYNTMLISWHKYRELLDMKEFGIPILGVSWTNVKGYINLKTIKPCDLEIYQRKAGNRSDDHESLVVHFDIKDFTLLTGKGSIDGEKFE